MYIYVDLFFVFVFFPEPSSCESKLSSLITTLGLNKYSVFLQKLGVYRLRFSARELPSHIKTKDIIFNVDHCGEGKKWLLIIGSEELVDLVSLKAMRCLKLLETCVRLNRGIEHQITYTHTHSQACTSWKLVQVNTSERDCLSR